MRGQDWGGVSQSRHNAAINPSRGGFNGICRMNDVQLMRNGKVDSPQFSVSVWGIMGGPWLEQECSCWLSQAALRASLSPTAQLQPRNDKAPHSNQATELQAPCRTLINISAPFLYTVFTLICTMMGHITPLASLASGSGSCLETSRYTWMRATAKQNRWGFTEVCTVCLCVVCV